jgi:hypothetical protein
LFTGWVRWVEAQRPKDRVTDLIGVSPSLAEGEWRRKELALSWRDSDPTSVICTLMDGPYRLPCRTVPVALAGDAQLLSW